MHDLGDLYAPRSARAQDAFTDRVPESEAFARALLDFRSDLRSGLLLTEYPRTNVLTFHGIGGIGKSALSQRLEAWARGSLPSTDMWGGPPPARPDIITRLDCAGAVAPDLDGLLVSMRDGAARAGVATPAFDLVLLSYWATANPGSPVGLGPGASSLPIDLGPQITESVTSSLNALGLHLGTAGLTVRAVRAAVDKLRDRRRDRRLATCPNLVPTLEAILHNPHGAAPFLPGLLNWDLSNLDQGEEPLWVVFIDAYEHVAGPSARDGERRIQGVVLSLPQVLFVISGRDRLDWDDDALIGTLGATGQDRWPGLGSDASGARRQHLVGALSDHDGDEFLRRAITRTDGAPALSADSESASWTRRTDFRSTSTSPWCGRRTCWLPDRTSRQISSAGRCPKWRAKLSGTCPTPCDRH